MRNQDHYTIEQSRSSKLCIAPFALRVRLIPTDTIFQLAPTKHALWKKITLMVVEDEFFDNTRAMTPTFRLICPQAIGRVLSW